MSGDRQTAFPGQHTEDGTQGLPFVIELWTEDCAAVQSVLARVQSMSLAQAVFAASRAEYPSRLIALRRGATIIASTGESEAAKIS